MIKILVVDDDFLIREFLTDILLASGKYQVVSAENGQAALDLYHQSQDVGLILSDMNMPVMDGLSLIKALRAEGAEVPVVVITGNNEISIAIEALNSGANDYLVKDENIQDTVVLSADKVLEKKRIQDENRKLLIDLQEALGELEVKNRFIRKTFGRYMSDEVVERLLESPDGLNLGGQTLTVTIMFTDLRGFTAISETLPPETVVEMLNLYLKEMTGIVSKYAGTINEIMGDGMLILFGAPTIREDDADRAVACALEMQLAMQRVNAHNRENDLPQLEMGIGINTGAVVAGNVGSDIRAKYAVVGSNVNLAARVESFTIGGQVLITQATRNAVSSGLKLNGEFSVSFKGSSKPVNIYDVAGINGDYQLTLPEVAVSYRALRQPLVVNFETLSEKISSGDIQEGHIVALAEKHGIFLWSAELEIRSNLKISLPSQANAESFIYAKVLNRREDDSYEINFTFVPKEMRSIFEQIV